MSESSKKDIMLKKAEMLHVCEVILQSSKFSVEFIWFISMIITNDAFLISLKLLVLSITQRWGIQLRCHTQFIQLNLY